MSGESTPTGQHWYGREIFGLFLLFWTLLLLLSLFSFDAADPSLNHAVSGGSPISNKAGLFGAYTAGFLNDLLGAASILLPIALGCMGAAYVSRSMHLLWWRWTGFTLLSLCVLVCCSAWDLSLGELRAGGVVGYTLAAFSRRLLSPFGAALLWFFVFFIGLQMFFDLSWKKVFLKIGQGCTSIAGSYTRRKDNCTSDTFSTRGKAHSSDNTLVASDAFNDVTTSDTDSPQVQSKLQCAFGQLAHFVTMLGNIRRSNDPMPEVKLETEKKGISKEECTENCKLTDTEKLRHQDTPLSDEDIPFADCEASGVPLDRTFAEQYALANPQVIQPASHGKVNEESKELSDQPFSSTKEISKQKPILSNMGKNKDGAQIRQTPLQYSVNEYEKKIVDAKRTGKVDKPIQKNSESDEKKFSQVSSLVQNNTLAPVFFKIPPLELLDKAKPAVSSSMEDIRECGIALMGCLQDFGIQGELVRAAPGPVVTTYMVRPAPGVSVRVFTRHADDIARSLMAVSVFIQAPVPGTDTVGIVIPNRNREIVNFRELAESDIFQKAVERMALPLVVGKDTTGRPYVADLSRMPHLLVAGATGQGKSVCLNAMLTSLLLRKQPSELKLLLVDPKRVEMGMYEGESHLVHPVVKEVMDARNALQWAVHEMDERYNNMSRLYTKNIAGYNARIASLGGKLPADCSDLKPMPYIVIVIDELADLMLQAKKDVEPCIIRLAQLARACGIHMIIATQRPSVDVVTGLIKANFPCRICFKVSGRQDSMTTLGVSGAEKLLGNGDMFYNPNGGQLTRLHGPYLRDDEVQSVVDYWKRQCKPEYDVDFSTWANEETNNESFSSGRTVDSNDPMYREVLDFIREKGVVSTSLLQRRFNIGFNKAARYMDQLDQDGLVGPAPGAGKPRPVLMR